MSHSIAISNPRIWLWSESRDTTFTWANSTRQRYDRAIAEWLANGRRVLPVPASNQIRPFSVNELLLAYLQHAGEFYAQDGEVSKEVVNLGHAISPVKNLYGLTPAAEFGPLALKAIRHYMIETQKLCRTEINKRIGRIKRAFKWAVSEELIPPSVFEGLRSVEGLRQGRSAARESEPVKPVPDAHVAALMPFVSPQVAAMILLQRLTGMRPGEVVIMRLCDLDRSSEIWLYTPTRHKTSYLGVEKQVPLGAKVRKLLEPFLDRPADAFLFSPKEAEEWRNDHRAVRRNPDRKTKIYACELRARERRKLAATTRPSKRPKRDCFDVNSYRRAIEYGIVKAEKAGVKIPHWHPHQLRHSRATEIRRAYGLEAAQVALGHSSADVTQIYAERNLELATKIAREMG